jgi:hypothetical protein
MLLVEVTPQSSVHIEKVNTPCRKRATQLQKFRCGSESAIPILPCLGRPIGQVVLSAVVWRFATPVAVPLE